MNSFSIPFIKPYVDFNKVSLAQFHLGKSQDANFFQLQFEESLENYLNCNTKHVCALNSGTSAMHLAFQLANFQESEVVYVANATYIASISPLLYQSKAVPRFIDVDRQTGNMDMDLLKDSIVDDIYKGKNPKGIVFTHNFGIPGNMKELLRIKSKYNLVLIEDAAEALGSEYDAQKCGTFSDYAVLSFNTNKICTTLGGGALVVNSLEEKKEVKKLANHYKSSTDYYHEKLGYNYRMNDFAAFIGCYQLKNINFELEKKRNIYEIYNMAFQDESQINIFQYANQGNEWNHWLNFVSLASEKTLLKVGEQLKRHGVEVRRFWVPLTQQPFLKRFIDSAYHRGTSEHLYKSCLLLPSSVQLTSEEQQRVIHDLRKIVKEKHK